MFLCNTCEHKSTANVNSRYPLLFHWASTGFTTNLPVMVITCPRFLSIESSHSFFITVWSQAPKLQSSLLIHSVPMCFQVQRLLQSSLFRLSRPQRWMLSSCYRTEGNDPGTSSEQAVMWTLGCVSHIKFFAVILFSVSDHLQTKISADLQIYSTFSHSSFKLSEISVLLSDCVLITPSYSTDRLHMCIQYTLLPSAIKNKLYFSLFPLVLGNQHL